ncbi:hypothetical protein KIPB_005142, partial [Kipferlia bialata]
IRSAHSKDKPYACPSCPLAFTTSQHLKRHTLSVHSGDTPHRCPFCVQRFRKRHQLSDHLREAHEDLIVSTCTSAAGEREREMEGAGTTGQEGEKGEGQGAAFDPEVYRGIIASLCKCPVCEFDTTYPSRLKRHIQSMHHDLAKVLYPGTTEPAPPKAKRKAGGGTSGGTGLVACPDCGRLFSKRSNMMTHYKTKHERASVFYCSVCGQESGYRSSIGRHIAVKHDSVGHVLTRVKGTGEGVCDVVGEGACDIDDVPVHGAEAGTEGMMQSPAAVTAPQL